MIVDSAIFPAPRKPILAVFKSSSPSLVRFLWRDEPRDEACALGDVFLDGPAGSAAWLVTEPGVSVRDFEPPVAELTFCECDFALVDLLTAEVDSVAVVEAGELAWVLPANSLTSTVVLAGETEFASEVAVVEACEAPAPASAGPPLAALASVPEVEAPWELGAPELEVPTADGSGCVLLVPSAVELVCSLLAGGTPDSWLVGESVFSLIPLPLEISLPLSIYA